MAIRYLISFLLFATSAIAQEWPFLPIIGGSAYSCGQTNGDSTCTIPAGPPSVTGVETIPVDTNLSGGEEPQQAKVTVDTLKSYIFNGLRVGTTPIANGSGNTNCLYDNSGILGEKSCVSTLIVGSTVITGGTNTNCLYNNAGILGDKSCLASLINGTTVITGATNGNCLYNNAGILGNKACDSFTNVYTTESGTGGTKLSAIATGTYAGTDQLVAVKGGNTDQLYTINNIFAAPPTIGNTTPNTGAFAGSSSAPGVTSTAYYVNSGTHPYPAFNSVNFQSPWYVDFGIFGGWIPLASAAIFDSTKANLAFYTTSVASGDFAAVSFFTDASLANFAQIKLQTLTDGQNLSFKLSGSTAGDFFLGTDISVPGNVRIQTVNTDAIVIDNNQFATFYQAPRLPAYTVASTLPAAGTIGRMAYVTDGAAALAWGATISGGSTVKYLVWDNGTNWTVMGK